MTLVANSNWSNWGGNLIDGGFSALFTLAMGRLALNGLFKASIPVSRLIDWGFKGMGIDSKGPDTFGNKIANYIPAAVSEFFAVANPYNGVIKVAGKVQAKEVDGTPKVDAKGKAVMIDGEVDQWEYSNCGLLVSGFGLSLLALAALEVKTAFWRESNPILNAVLTKVSPFRVIVGDTWITKGISSLVGRVTQAVRN